MCEDQRFTGLTARRGHGKDSAWLESSTWSELANQLVTTISF